jgi:hypothetical protein
VKPIIEPGLTTYNYNINLSCFEVLINREAGEEGQSRTGSSFVYNREEDIQIMAEISLKKF